MAVSCMLTMMVIPAEALSGSGVTTGGVVSACKVGGKKEESDIPALKGRSDPVILEPKIIHTGPPPNTADHPAPIIGAMGIGLSVAVLMVLVDEHKK